MVESNNPVEVKLEEFGVLYKESDPAQNSIIQGVKHQLTNLFEDTVTKLENMGERDYQKYGYVKDDIERNILRPI